MPIDTTVVVPMDTTMVDSTNTDEGFEDGPELEAIIRDTMIISIPLDTKTTVCLDSLIDIRPNTAFSCTLAGNLSVTPNNNSDCIELEPRAGFNDSEFVCVVHCDTAMVCDTTIINICPKVSLGEDLSICSGDSISLNPSGGSGLYRWTTTDITISCDTCKNTSAMPTTSSSYIITNTTPNACTTSDTLALMVAAGPVISNVLFNPPNNCQEDGFITVQVAPTLEGISYSIAVSYTHLTLPTILLV